MSRQNKEKDRVYLTGMIHRRPGKTSEHMWLQSANRTSLQNKKQQVTEGKQTKQKGMNVKNIRNYIDLVSHIQDHNVCC